MKILVLLKKILVEYWKKCPKERFALSFFKRIHLLFTNIFCIAKLTDGLKIWKNITIYGVYNADMLEQQLKHWVEESDIYSI
jgi:hypothetical protein